MVNKNNFSSLNKCNLIENEMHGLFKKRCTNTMCDDIIRVDFFVIKSLKYIHLK